MFEEKSLAKLRGIILAAILISGTLTVAYPSILPDASAAPAGKPSKVDNLVLIISSSQIRLMWDAPNDNGSPIIGYHIERQAPGAVGFVTLVANTFSTTTTYLDTGLTPNTTYNYKVSAINAIGEGTSSNQRHGTTLPGPSVTLTTTASDPTNLSPIPVTATFSEGVYGFTISDITVTNGVASNFVGVDGNAVFTFDVTPSAQGLVSISVAANVATDVIGSLNTASNTLTRTYDSGVPSVVLSTTASDPTNVSPIPVTATFSESVTGFTIGDITVTNGVASNLAGGPSVYTFDVTPSAQGLVSISVAANVAVDSAANGNTASNTLTRTYDSTNPSVVLSTTASDPTNVSPIPVTATFSESVTGFAIGDITVTNGVASNLAGSGAVYTFDVTPSSNGLVSIDVDADVAIDTSGNGNTAAATLSITYDTESPSVELSTTSSDPTNVSPIPVTATFSEDVTGFELSDITVTNGVASNLAGSGAVYTFDVTPFSNGLVSVDVDADVAQDAAGNGNTAADTLSRTVNVFILTATVVDQTIINLDWNDAPTVVCSDLIGYKIYRIGPDDEGFVLLASVDAQTTEYSDTELDGDTDYTYKIVAVYENGECPVEETNEVTETTTPFLNGGALSYDIWPPTTDGISFSSVQGGTDTEGFGGRLASYSNDIPTQIMNTGIEQRFQVDIYDNNGIAAVKRVVINMFFDYMQIQKADTYFMYEEDGQKLTVSDPNGFFGDVKVHRTYTEAEMILVFIFTPQKPMPITDLVINAEDEYRNNQNTIVFGAFEIQGEPIVSVESNMAAAEIPYYKNPDWNQFVIDEDGNMLTYDSFGNLEKNQTPIMDEIVQYGSYIGKSERHDDGFYDKVSAEKVRAQKLVDSRDPHKIFQEPQKVFKVNKVFKYPSTVGKADRENVKVMDDLKQKEHSKALNMAKKLS